MVSIDGLALHYDHPHTHMLLEYAPEERIGIPLRPETRQRVEREKRDETRRYEKR